MSKLCVISGATSGIGLEVASQMALKGYDLALIGRSNEKGQEAVSRIKGESPAVNISYYNADLSSIADVKRVAAEISAAHPVIDILINNAGGVFSSFGLSVDGIEMTMANNHLNYYILTLSLLDNIRKSDDGRIIVVASDSHYRGKINFDSFTEPKGYFVMKAYEQSKLGNVLFAYDLCRRLEGSGITVIPIHPGVVKTNIGAKGTNTLNRVFWWVFSRLAGGISPEESAKHYVWLATQDKAREYKGKYFDKGKIKRSSALSYDEALQGKLWNWSEEVTGVKFQ